MAEMVIILSDSDSDDELVQMKPPSKRRRPINPSAITPVPVYSNKVSTSLLPKLTAAVLAKNDADDSAVSDSWWKSPSPKIKKSTCQLVIDSEEEMEFEAEEREATQTPSPPPPGIPPAEVSRDVRRKIHQVNKELGAICSLLSQSPECSKQRGTRKGPGCPLLVEQDCDIEMSPNSTLGRLIPLKFRCRTDIHKIPLLSSMPLSEAVNELSIKLKVQPSHILLLRKDMELPTHLTADDLGLSIADIIDCFVITENDTRGSDGSFITVHLQGKEKGSGQEYSLHREAPLGSIFSQYVSCLSKPASSKVQFHFDGSRIKHNQTPSQLDMEDGDIIEVWT